MFTPRAPETVISIRSLPSWMKDSRKDGIRKGVPLLMEALHRALDSGMTLPAALRHVPNDLPECPRALVEEMDSVGLLMDAGASMADALTAVAKRVDMPEFDMLVSSCAEENRTRTDIMQSLTIVSGRLHERNHTLGLMHSTENQAVLTGSVVGCVPFLALMFCNVAFPQQVEAMSHSTLSQASLAISFALVIAGVAWICSLGRTTPGQTSNEVASIAKAIPGRMVAPLMFCFVPALFLVGLAPLLAR